jgi:hypothetical protein
MAAIRDLRYHSRVYAEYNRRGPEFGTHAFGFPDLGPVKPSLCYLLSWSMAGMLEGGQGVGSENVTDVHLLYLDSDHRVDNITELQ